MEISVTQCCLKFKFKRNPQFSIEHEIVLLSHFANTLSQGQSLQGQGLEHHGESNRTMNDSSVGSCN